MPTDSELSLREQAEKILDGIRPALLLDGGGVELVRLDENRIYLKIRGACRVCGSLPVTKAYGIEAELISRLDQPVEIHWIDD